MKRAGRTFAIAPALLAAMLCAAGLPALAQQQTFSSTSSGTPPSPRPTATGSGVGGIYLGIYPNSGPYHPHPPCHGCRPPNPPRPTPVPRPTPPAPRPAPTGARPTPVPRATPYRP